MKEKEGRNEPHAATAFENAGTALEGVIVVGSSMALPFWSLIEQVDFIKGGNISGVGEECDEERNISGVIFGVFAIWVELHPPLVPSNAELVARNAFSNAHSLCQRVALYFERVRPQHCLCHGFGTAATLFCHLLHRHLPIFPTNTHSAGYVNGFSFCSLQMLKRRR